jgi:hypothetical protein
MRKTRTIETLLLENGGAIQCDAIRNIHLPIFHCAGIDSAGIHEDGILNPGIPTP